MNIKNYTKGLDGRIRLYQNQLEIRRYGFLERINNNLLGQNYPLDSLLDVRKIQRVLLITLSNQTSVLRIESLENLPVGAARMAPEVTLENSIEFAPNKLLVVNAFFELLRQAFIELSMNAEFKQCFGMEDVRREYNPPLAYYPAQRGETGFVNRTENSSSQQNTKNTNQSNQAQMLPVKKTETSGLDKLCPHCSHQLTVAEDTVGLNCPACENRVIVRDGQLLTIEQAKNRV